MTQLHVSTNSRLRTPLEDYGRGVKHANDAARLLLLATLALYVGDAYERHRLYHTHKGSSSAFFLACALGKMLPERTILQSLLDDLCPASKRLNLYIGLDKESQPTHYIRLEKGIQGLWQLRAERVSAVRSRQRVLRNGVVAHWNTCYTPIPDIASQLPVHLKRVQGRGAGILELVAEIDGDLQLQHQLTHCAAVCELFGNLKDDQLTVRCVRGKATFAVHGHEAIDSGFVTPFAFELLDIRPYAKPVRKPNVVVWGNASSDSLLIAQGCKSIQPQIRHAEEFNSYESDLEKQFVQELLLSRLFPFVGIGRTNRKLDILGLSYEPKADKAMVVPYATGRREAAYTMIPTFYPPTHSQGLWRPNWKSVDVLRCMVGDLDAHGSEWQHWRMRLFTKLGLVDLDSHIRAFQRWRQPLGEEHVAALRRILG